MWPKVLAQLIELLPHASRLMPLAERFFQNKGELTAQLDESSRKAMEDFRAELGKGAAQQESLYRQLNEQSAQVEAALREARAARTAAESAQNAMAGLEKRVAVIATTSVICLLLLVVVAALCIALLVRR